MTKFIGVKAFNRQMYHYLDDLPLVIVNLKTKKPKFIVLPPDEKIIKALTEKEGGAK